MEKWKPVPVVGYEDRYEVSDLGRVRNAKTGYVLTPMRTGSKRSQYSTVRFSTNPRVDKKVHALVLEAFVGKAPTGHLGMHNDNDTFNNKLSNLKWGTHAENSQQAARDFRYSHQKIPVELRPLIRSRRRDGESGAALAREYGVSQQAICDIFKFRKK